MFIDGDATGAAAIEVTAFDDFYVATARRTLALARSLTSSWADAEDLVQEAYADAHRRWATVGAYDDPAAWVRRAVVNRSASRWRRLGREVRALTRLGSRRVDDGAVDPIDADLWRQVAGLPVRQAQAIALFYVDDLSVDQIAEVLGCSTGTVKTHLSRARATLHETLPKEADDDQ